MLTFSSKKMNDPIQLPPGVNSCFAGLQLPCGTTLCRRFLIARAALPLLLITQLFPAGKLLELIWRRILFILQPKTKPVHISVLYRHSFGRLDGIVFCVCKSD